MNSQKLIYSLKELEKELDSLNEIYKEFFAVISKEEEAISNSDLSLLEKLVPEKVSCGGLVESSINNISSTMQIIASYVPTASDLSLSNIIEVLEKQHKDLSGLENQVLSHLFVSLKKQIKDMIEQHSDLYPKIEANKYLVDTLLENHRQTHRFWLSMISQSQGTYGAKGSHTKQNLTSMISVKA